MHSWDPRYIGWGSAYPAGAEEAMGQLVVSDRITEASKKLVQGRVAEEFGRHDA